MSALPDDLLPELRSAGVDLAGVLTPERYDELVAAPWRTAEILPTARSAVLLGTGGPTFFRNLPTTSTPDPVDDRMRELAQSQSDAWSRAGHASRAFLYCDRRDGAFADLLALGVAGGLGVDSRLRILLHPRYGPWWALRALLLTERAFEPTPPLDWTPCDGCPAPCAEACPVGDVVLPSGVDVAACFRTRGEVDACRLRCAARRACVFGRDEAYDDDAEVYFATRAWQAYNERSR